MHKVTLLALFFYLGTLAITQTVYGGQLMTARWVALSALLLITSFHWYIRQIAQAPQSKEQHDNNPGLSQHDILFRARGRKPLIQWDEMGFTRCHDCHLSRLLVAKPKPKAGRPGANYTEVARRHFDLPVLVKASTTHMV